jgi:hypothetical protein
MSAKTFLTITLSLCLLLTACGLEQEGAADSTPTIPASATFTPPPPPTPLPTATPTLTPTPPPAPDTLLQKAGEICEKAFARGVSGGTAQRPLMTVVFIEGDEFVGGVWRMPIQGRYTHSLTEAKFASDVKSLVCIREQKIQTGSYTDGQPAYQLRLRVRVAQWDSEKFVMEK